MSLPGLPCVIIGHNERIAWGVTNLHYDVQDLYREHLNLQTGEYLFRGKTEKAVLENDVIPVKGEKPIPLATWVTRHGPLVQSDEKDLLALKWTAAEPGGFEFPLLEVDRARNWQEFTAGLSRFPGPGQNWVYADVDGNIGYHAAGNLPIRRSYVGDVPVDGSSGDFEWEGYIPSSSCRRTTIRRRDWWSRQTRTRSRRIIRTTWVATSLRPIDRGRFGRY